MKVMDQISAAMTKRGQFTQAAILALAKDDPMTALEYAQRQIGKLNKDGAARYGRKWKDFSLNEDELKACGISGSLTQKALWALTSSLSYLLMFTRA